MQQAQVKRCTARQGRAAYHLVAVPRYCTYRDMQLLLCTFAHNTQKFSYLDVCGEVCLASALMGGGCTTISNTVIATAASGGL